MAAAGGVQNLRIIHGADGQIQVQGLLPGNLRLVYICSWLSVSTLSRSGIK